MIQKKNEMKKLVLFFMLLSISEGAQNMKAEIKRGAACFALSFVSGRRMAPAKP